MQIPQVTPELAGEFFRCANEGQPWTYNDIAIIGLEKWHTQFASDFANDVIRQIFRRLIAEQEAAKKKLVIAKG